MGPLSPPHSFPLSAAVPSPLFPAVSVSLPSYCPPRYSYCSVRSVPPGGVRTCSDLHSCTVRSQRSGKGWVSWRPPQIYSCKIVISIISMQGRSDATAKELDLEYRDYLQNGEGLLPGIEIGQYRIAKEIGKGAFGKIYLAHNRKGQSFAIKLMDLQKIRREANPKIQEIRWRLIQNEPKLMQQCSSPNVLRCDQIFENESLKVLVLEYCNGHTLQEYIDRKMRIKEDEAVRILRQIINGIAELHRHSIIHRDLKADNIMEHEGQYKIIDLGFSKKLDIANQSAEVKATILGTVTTMAPEVLSKQSYGLKADIWSIGVIFFQMVFGIMLYDSVSARQRLKQIEQKRYFSPDKQFTFNGITISVHANNFLFRALQVNTDKRMGWRELLEHPLIKQKEQEPIGDRFLVQNHLHLPQVNLELELEPTTVTNIKGELSLQQGELSRQQGELSRQQGEISNNRFDLKLEPKKDEPRDEERDMSIDKAIAKVPIKKIDFKLDIGKEPFPPKRYAQQEEDPRWNAEMDNYPKTQQPGNEHHISKRHIIRNVRNQQQDSADFKWVKLAHLQCLKTQLIYQQIIVPIERGYLLDLQDRQVVEFMFLVSARCFQNVSPISVRVQSQKARVNPIVKNLHEQVRDLYQKVLQKFEAFSQKLTNLQNNFFQMFLDFFRKRFLKKDYDEKSSFTSGIELPQDQQGCVVKGEDSYGDYSKVDQINYTYNHYVSSILRKMTDNKNKPAAIVEKVASYLRYYDRIGLVKLEELDGETFNEYVSRIVL